jgi:hypothetical protein
MHILKPVMSVASASNHWDIKHSTHPQISQLRPMQVLVKPRSQHKAKLYDTPMYMG